MKTISRVLLTVCASLFACGASALEAPTLISWQLDPYAQRTENVIAALERVTPQADGGLVVDVSFSLEPSEAPTVQFVLSSSQGKSFPLIADAEACSFPEQSMMREGRFVYAYTIPPLKTPEGNPIAPNRLTYVKRARFGGHAGARLECGGYAIIVGDELYLGRSGTFVVGGQEMTFDGGICVVPSTPQEEAATFSLRRPTIPENTERLIRGKRLSFPVKLKEVRE